MESVALIPHPWRKFFNDHEPLSAPSLYERDAAESLSMVDGAKLFDQGNGDDSGYFGQSFFFFLKATRDGDGALERPSIQNFKNELKSLAGMMGELDRPVGTGSYTRFDSSPSNCGFLGKNQLA